MEKRLTEAKKNIEVYMNTWANYNENGTDLSRYGIKSIKDGWMTIDEAREFADKYAEDEPFINDIDTYSGISLGVNEYSNVEDSLDLLERINNLDDSELEELGAIIEANGDNLEDALDIFDNHSYLYLSDVSNDSDLAYAVIDSIGDIKEVVDNPENYIDEKGLRRDIELEYDDSNLREEAEEEINREHEGTEIAIQDIPEKMEFATEDTDAEDVLDGIKNLDELTNEDYNEVKDAINEAIVDELSVAPIYFDMKLEDGKIIVTNIEFAPEDTFDRDEEIEDYVENHRDQDIDLIVDEIIDNPSDKDIENYFDYEGFGRDLRYDGWVFTDKGAIQID